MSMSKIPVSVPIVTASTVQSPIFRHSQVSLDPEEEILVCPVCFKEATAPFMQCRNGHIVCKDCDARVELCPKCRVAKPFARNLALEQMSFNCAFSKYGCVDKMIGAEKGTHQSNCNYRPIECLVTKCDWKGGRSQFIQHLSNDHNVSRTESPTEVKMAKVLTVNSATEKDVWPSQLCIVVANGCDFLMEVAKSVKAENSGVTQTFLNLSVGNLTSWCGGLTGTPAQFKARVLCTSPTRNSIFGWDQKVAANQLTYSFTSTAYVDDDNDSTDLEDILEDAVVKITIVPN